MHDIVIIGSGPAGLTAAIYAARAGLKPLCIEGVAAGGQLMITTDVENYPGFPELVTGPDLMARFRAQAARLGTEFVTDDVAKVDFSKRPFRAWTSDKDVEAKAIIVSTGASARYLGLPSELALRSHGVSACATCDGFFFRGQDVAVVGGGDTALEEATYLAKLCRTVKVIHRRDTLRACKSMQNRAFKIPNLEFVWDTEVVEVRDVEKKAVTSLIVQNVKTKEKNELAVTGLFIAVGHVPNTEIFKGILDLDDTGYVKTKPGTTQTNVAGVFAAGDVQDKVYRQAVTAAGTGCMAALEAERWLAAQEH